ncbi:flippase-like domain-containing protein [Pseudoxanthomonas japonensis]|nr:flippase-like domain-containing protein [Pseudoxanthomonas japonensis]
MLGLLIGIACLALFVRTAAHHWEAFRALKLGGDVVLYLLLAAAAYLLTYLVSSRAWQLSLRTQGVRFPYLESLKILLVAQIGKYIPGNIGQHIGRVVLARRAGIDPSTCVSSMLVETMLLLIGAAFCSLAAFDLFLSAYSQHEGMIRRNVLGALLATVLVLSIAVLFPSPRRWLAGHVIRQSSLLSRGGALLSSRILLAHGLSLVLGALALWLAVQAASPLHSSTFSFEILGIYSVAWLIGFVVPGAPAGLGIREALLVLGLSPLVGVQVATTSTALFRVTTVLGDGLAFCLGFAMRRRAASKPST